MTTNQFAYEALFDPLGIWTGAPRHLWRTGENGRHNLHPYGLWDESTGLPWKTDTAGHATGCCGLHLTVCEVAKFGQLYLDGGRSSPPLWGRARERGIAGATSSQGQQLIPEAYVQASAQPQSTGGPGPEPEVTPYGYLWWVPNTDQGTYYAWGHGRQYIYVVPKSNLVLAITAHQGRNDPARILNRFVVPAVRND